MLYIIEYDYKSVRYIRKDLFIMMSKNVKTLGFWTAIFAVLFYVGDMLAVSAFMVVQTLFFVIIAYMNLTERTYIYIFFAYLVLFFAGFSFYSTFMVEPSFGNQH